MPPKAKSAERLQQEAAAQRARAAALQHLAKTGAGPSQKEIAQQQKDRERWTNATTQAVQQRLAASQPATAATPGAPTRDNTLAAMAAHRARMMLQGGAAGSASGSASGGAFDAAIAIPSSLGGGGESEALPDGWKPAVDPASGETYYWNETTKETSWKRPKHHASAADQTTEANDAEEGDLEDGWEEVADPQSGQTYYWHRDSNETTWTKPVKKTVSLEQARQAKSRLDAILKLCGPSTKPAASATPQANNLPTHSSTANASASRKRDAASGDEEALSPKRVRASHKVDTLCSGFVVEASHIRMKNTARMYSSAVGGGALRTSRDNGAPPAYEAHNPGRPGSVKKQKQLQKAKESLVAKQTELGTLVGKLEDRDTQQQAFTSLLELLPPLDAPLVADLYSRIEKNKNPGRSSTRRMFVLVLAAMSKCHPIATAHLLPRMLSYLSLRLRDKEGQITDACAILCSAITLYVIPHAGVNSKGNLSPKKKSVMEPSDPSSSLKSPADDSNFHTFGHIVSHLSKETNAVGEHATRCIASIVCPTEFDGSTTPSSEVLALHGKRVTGFVRVMLQSLVSKMNESTQYAGFSTSFLLLQAVVALAKLLALQCNNKDVFNMILPHLGSLVDAIEDVFRDGPREDWVVRKRGIELLVQLIDLFVCGETAENNSGQAFFDENLERIRRLVTEARHDPVSAVRDAALPAVFLFDRLVKLFPRREQGVAPPSPFKRVYSARSGVGIATRVKTATSICNGSGGSRPRLEQDEKPIHHEYTSKNETDQETDFEESPGDESATPHDIAIIDGEREEEKSVVIPPLKLTPTTTSTSAPLSSSHFMPKKKNDTVTAKATRSRIKIPRIAAPKTPIVDRVAVPFQPPTEEEEAFPEEPGDEHMVESPDNVADDMAEVLPPKTEETAVPLANDPVNEEADEVPPISRADAAILAAAEGETDLALRLTFLEDDMTLLRRVLTMSGDQCTSSLSRASRTALCAAFLEFLDPGDEEESEGHDMWLAFMWLKDLTRQARFVQQLDPRVLRALELRLNCIAQQPNRAGLMAADILNRMGL